MYTLIPAPALPPSPSVPWRSMIVYLLGQGSWRSLSSRLEARSCSLCHGLLPDQFIFLRKNSLNTSEKRHLSCLNSCATTGKAVPKHCGQIALSLMIPLCQIYFSLELAWQVGGNVLSFL